MEATGSHRALLNSLAVGDPMAYGSASAAKLRITRSLQRSEQEYGLDRGAIARERVLTAHRIAEVKAREERFLRLATPGIDWLHQQIGGLGYCTLLTDRTGATVELRAIQRFAHEFDDRGLRVGACWSETDQGTCGIGTAIVDQAPLLVRETEHFLIRNHGISCSAVPVFGTCEEILGVLNTTALSANTDRRSLSVAYNLSVLTAARIEHAFFYEEHASAWVIRLSSHPDGWASENGVLIAFDEGGRILGMSRQLKHQLADRFLHRELRIEDLLDVSVERLLNYAHTNPGVPITIPCVLGVSAVHAQLRSPRKQVRPAVRTIEPDHSGFGGLAVSDPKLLENIARIKLLANNRIPILLLGETGAGKECFAKAIHDYSNRRSRPFVAINCAAIPDTLIESELFGYKEGAFTGAKSKGSPGKIAEANGGTLFLDEIGDMPLALQTRLLRVLAEGELLALGATTPERVDVAVVCATHRDLPAMVRAKTFREDLFYRLNAATFRLPPLRERTDIRDVVRKVFAEEAQRAERDLALSPELERRLCRYSWPGNIRELRNVLRYAIAVCIDNHITAEHLPDGFGAVTQDTPPGARTGQRSQPDRHADAERELMIGALNRCGWSATAACRLLEMPRSTFYRKLKEYNIVSPNAACAVPPLVS